MSDIRRIDLTGKFRDNRVFPRNNLCQNVNNGSASRTAHQFDMPCIWHHMYTRRVAWPQQVLSSTFQVSLGFRGIWRARYKTAAKSDN